MKTPEQIQEYLKYITKQKEEWAAQPDASTNTNTIIATRVAEEIESALLWVLDLNPNYGPFMAKAERILAEHSNRPL